jgi:uncharacterized protein
MKRYLGEGVGEPTLRDIFDELKRPGRDPRSDFEAPSFRDDVNKLEDLQEGMILEGVVTNVTNFGAFVDVGVHQDGLVHISQLSDRFVQHPSEAVKVGQKLKVRVLEVDLVRGRIALSARSDGGPVQRDGGGNRDRGPGRGGGGAGKGGGGSRPGGSSGGGDGFRYNPFAQLKKS